jgi:parallel beta-helix repeat protein
MNRKSIGVLALFLSALVLALLSAGTETACIATDTRASSPTSPIFSTLESSREVIATNTYANITVAEAKAMIESDPSLVLLDVRSLGEYDSGHLRNSRLIPLGELATRLDELDKSDHILVYCRLGVRSTSASQTLSDNNFSYIYNLVGGITAWIDAGLPAFTRYSSLQQAIDNAQEGAILNVSIGIYVGNILINKTLALMGENQTGTVIDGNRSGTPLKITSNGTVVTDFTIQNSGTAEWGVQSYACSSVSLVNVSIVNNENGLKLDQAMNTALIQSTVRENSLYGVLIEYSPQNLLRNNTIEGQLFNFGVHGWTLEDYLQDIDSSNTVNGKPIRYLINQTTDQDFMSPGYIAVVNSANIVIGNTSLHNNEEGLLIAYSQNLTVTNNLLERNRKGILLAHSTATTLRENTLFNNTLSIDLEHSTNNTIIENNITSNQIGIHINSSAYNTLFHNNLEANSQHVLFSGDSYPMNSWNDTFEGNYWSSIGSRDMNHDGIGVPAYTVTPENTAAELAEFDHHPLMGTFRNYAASGEQKLSIISNSSIENVEYVTSNATVRIHISNATSNQTFGFCRIVIPHSLMNVDNLTVIIDDGKTAVLHPNYALRDNGTHRWIYFAYEQSEHEVAIIPEHQPTMLLVVLILIASSIAAMNRGNRKLGRKQPTY